MVPHAPQLTGSLFVSTQPPLHTVSDAEAQPAAHAPLLQTAVVPEQVVPQAPQFFGSFAVFTHTPPQLVVPAGQVHLLSPHVWLAAHRVAQLPQCAASLVVSTHELPHWVRPMVQELAHAPTSHT
jgi:hypothetical protein